jgi:hypothetical protein
MKTSPQKKILLTAIPALFAYSGIFAQVASWNFNNVLTGTGSANSVAGNASLGSTIAAGGAFNGGTVYFGEGNWPAGPVDLNAYLEFSITPTVSHNITISSLAMQIRRSTTGTSGAGPNSWSLRSSLDGYAADVAAGVLTSNSSPATIATLGIAFMNLASKVTFRLYGYNATISSGGLNRFVYDDIVASGSTVLPIVFDYFNVKSVDQSASISWKLGGEGNLSSLTIERAEEGRNFKLITSYSSIQLNTENSFEFTDQLNHPSGNYMYRLQLTSADGHSTYSSIQTISFESENGFKLQGINSGYGNNVSFRVNTEKAGNYTFSLLNLNGGKVAVKSVQLSTGSQIMQLENRPLKPGIYVLLGENSSQIISTKIMVL